MKHNETNHNGTHNEQDTQDLLDREALSALMDNELSDFELQRLLQRVEHRPSLLAEWERFGLMRAALQPDPLRSPASADFASRVMAEIENSIAEQGPLPAANDAGAAPQTGWVRNATRVAVAASVTFAVFVGMQSILQNPGAGDALPALASGENLGNQGATQQNQQLAVDAEAQQRLNDYIRSVTIPARPESQSAPYNILLDSPQLRPVSDRELLHEVEREPEQP